MHRPPPSGDSQLAHHISQRPPPLVRISPVPLWAAEHTEEGGANRTTPQTKSFMVSSDVFNLYLYHVGQFDVDLKVDMLLHT